MSSVCFPVWRQAQDGLAPSSTGRGRELPDNVVAQITGERTFTTGRDGDASMSSDTSGPVLDKLPEWLAGHWFKDE